MMPNADIHETSGRIGIHRRQSFEIEEGRKEGRKEGFESVCVSLCGSGTHLPHRTQYT